MISPLRGIFLMHHLSLNSYSILHNEKLRKVSNDNLPRIAYRVSFPHTIIPWTPEKHLQSPEMTNPSTGVQLFRNLSKELRHFQPKVKMLYISCISCQSPITIMSIIWNVINRHPLIKYHRYSPLSTYLWMLDTGFDQCQNYLSTYLHYHNGNAY